MSKKKDKKPITVWLDDEENEMLKRYSKMCGLSQTEFIRQLCKGNTPKPEPTKAFWDMMNALYDVHSGFMACAKYEPSALEICKEIECLIHNHFAFNSVSFLDGKKYNYSNAERQRLRDASDRLCREYGLSVINNPHKAPSRPVWLDEKAGKPTRYNVYREDISNAKVMQNKGMSGKHLTTNPPFGYMKSPDDKEQWIIDEPAAEVVKEIFDLCISGLGPTQIAKKLKVEKVMTPTEYWNSIGRK